MTVYGYARVSTQKQDITRQIRNIMAFSPDIKAIYQDHFTGTSTDRPEFSKLLKRLKAGDTVIFDSVSRFSRTAAEGFQLYKELFDKDISLVFLKEPQINTETYRKGLEINLPNTDNRIIKPILEGVKTALQEVQKEQIRIAFEQAEKEVLDLRQRTREGMISKNAGQKISAVKTGMKYKNKRAEEIKKAIAEMSGKMQDKDIIALLGCSRNTYYKYKKEII